MNKKQANDNKRKGVGVFIREFGGLSKGVKVLLVIELAAAALFVPVVLILLLG